MDNQELIIDGKTFTMDSKKFTLQCLRERIMIGKRAKVYAFASARNMVIRIIKIIIRIGGYFFGGIYDGRSCFSLFALARIYD